MRHLKKYENNSPGRIHDDLKDTLMKWLKHYTNEQILSEIMDKNLPISSISDQGFIEDEDIQLAIKLLRRM
jgi:hypothetical protein